MGPVSQPLLAPPTLTFDLGDRSIPLAYGLAPLVVWSSRETADTPREGSSSWVVGKSLWKEGHPHIELEMPFLVYPVALREDRLCWRGGSSPSWGRPVALSTLGTPSSFWLSHEVVQPGPHKAEAQGRGFRLLSVLLGPLTCLFSYK